MDRLGADGRLTRHEGVIGVGCGGAHVFFERAQVEALKEEMI